MILNLIFYEIFQATIVYQNFQSREMPHQPKQSVPSDISVLMGQDMTGSLVLLELSETVLDLRKQRIVHHVLVDNIVKVWKLPGWFYDEGGG